ncbi:MAG: AraC family transcriptional regulator [Lachnospiraceae bacterium]|nr:AraC family transcriptional regulator [Lachnospiraceae bacterium]
MTKKERICFFEEMVKNCYNLTFWEYDKDLNHLDPLTEEIELMAYFFDFSSAKKNLTAYLATNPTKPILLSDSVGLMWVALPDNAPKKDEPFIYVFGPMFVNESSPSVIRKRISSGSQPQPIRRKVVEALSMIPVIPTVSIFQFATMLHLAVNNEKIKSGDLRHEIENNTLAHETITYKDAEAITSNEHRGAQQIDYLLLEAVRTGNEKYKEILNQASFISSGVRGKRSDSIRNAKNSVILFIGLCSRAAMNGGVPSEIAFQKCDFYVDMVECCSTITEAMEINHTMLDDYIQTVRKYRQKNTSYSKAVQSCIDYIEQRVTEKITIQRLAKICGYSDYYLTRKFKEETGKTVNEYINYTKIQRAKTMLTTTNYTVQEISDSLEFCSRSYFSSVFEKIEKCSPTEYRNR